MSPACRVTSKRCVVVCQTVEEILSAGGAASSVDGEARRGGLSEAEIALCFAYASEDAPVDLDQLFPGARHNTEADGKEI